jgi:L-ascorbate metabolism protein UlaG (beta-lactamase superfamily)
MLQTRELSLPATEDRPDIEHGSLFFIGTATVLLRYADFTILTDPNFLHKGEQIYIGYGLRSTRLTNPAINFEQLPTVDFVILSHMHEDHFDRLVAEKLDKSLPIITTGQAADVLRTKGFTALYPLNTWQRQVVSKGDMTLRITAMPATHAHRLLKKIMPPVNGSMLEFITPAGQTTLRLYITGDTLLFEQMKEIPHRYPDIDLALFHLGGTKIGGILLTMDAKQGVEALRLIKPHNAIPVHYDDYKVFKSPLEDFKKAVSKAHIDKQVTYLNAGETYTFQVPKRRWE